MSLTVDSDYTKNKLIRANTIKHIDKIPDDSIDIILTDPPYFIPNDSASSIFGNRTNADNSVTEYFYEKFFMECLRIMKPTGCLYIFCNHKSYPLFYNILNPILPTVGDSSKNTSSSSLISLLIWDKILSKLGYTYRNQHELIIFSRMPMFKKIPTGDGNVLRFRGVKQAERLHPAEKPIELLIHMLKRHGKNNMVLDCFAGSGNVGEACIRLGNNFTLIELDKGHFEKLKKRFNGRTEVIEEKYD